MRLLATPLFALIVFAAPAWAQIVVDGTPAEWNGAAPSDANSFVYRVGTAGGSLNEFVWNDAEGDVRTDFTSNGSDELRPAAIDLLEVRFASTSDSLYYLIETDSSFNVASGNGAPFVQITVQHPTGPATRGEFLGGFSNALVPTDAQWDFLIMTQFGTGSNGHQVFSDNFASSVTVGRAITGGDLQSGYIEGSLPWSALGGAPSDNTLRMTASIFRANQDNNAYTGGDNSRGGTQDFVTITTGNTYDALIPANDNGSQGRLDYAFDVEFLSSSEVLPVELTAFTGAADGNRAALRWTTASETGNDGFEVQMLTGAAFAPVGWVEGAGTTLEARSYAFTTAELAPGTYTFRLRQLDLDGAESLTGTVEVTVTGAAALSVAPNPSREAAQVTLSVPNAQHVEVSAYDALGRRVATLFSGSADGSVPMTLSGAAPGLYVIVAEGETFRTTTTATVLR